MPAVTNEKLIEQLQWRYATKKFDPSRVISADNWSTLEAALVLTPSSYGLQPWQFFVLTDREQREKLVAHSWGQRQVADASHTVVMAIRANFGEADIDRYLARMVEIRGGSVEQLAGFRKMMVGGLLNPASHFNLDEWAAKQVYIALGNFMTAAAMLGIDTCPMEGIAPTKYDELLGLPARGYKTCVVCVAGYRAADDKHASLPKVRFLKEQVVTHLS